MHCIQASQIYDQSLSAYIDSPIGGKNEVQNKALARFLRFLTPGARVLDIGCGPGGNAKLMIKANPLVHVTGVDLSKAMIGYARKSVPGGTFHCKDIRVMQYPENAYDAVILASVVFHLNPEELIGLIKNIAAALKPDGLLFLNFWSGMYSGFKRLDFAERPMMVYYYDDSFLFHLVRFFAFGNLAVYRYQRKLETAVGAETITDNYYYGQTLKNVSEADMDRYDAMKTVLYRIFERGGQKRSR